MALISSGIKNYFQNSDVKMTKESYFEMCELMGDEPNPDEIPVEIEDFPEEVQTAFEIYHVLQDHWEGMSGTYMGKNLNNISTIFEIYDVSRYERKTMLEFIAIIDRERMTLMETKRKQEESLRSQKSPN